MAHSRDANYRALTRIAVAAVVLVWIGCSRAGRQLPVSDEHFENTILADFRARANLTESLRLQMTVEIASNDERAEVRQILSYRRPDKFRLQALDPMNVTRVVIVVKADLLRVFYVREYEGIEAPLRDDILRRLFRMDVRVSDIRAAISADPFSGGAAQPTAVLNRGEKIIVTRPSERKGWVDEIAVARINGESVASEWRVQTASGDVEQTTRFEDYREIGGILRPMTVTIERPKDATRLRFRVSEAETNPTLSDASFNFDFPPNAKIERLP